jgi:hypothetical protein
METPGFGILMILATVALAFGLGVAVIARLLCGQPPRVGRLAVLAGAWVVLYLAALLAVSLRSDERVLGWDADKKFCGFYIDCHRQVGVAGVEVLDSLGAAHPAGRWHVVTLRVGSDAKVARLRFYEPRVRIRTDGGRRVFTRSADGEAALARLRGPQRPLTDELGPGGAYTTAIVFDLPSDVRDPRLDVTDMPCLDRVVEFTLIGDEDSFLHARTTIRVTP